MNGKIKPISLIKYTVKAVSLSGNPESHVMPCYYYAWLLRTHLLESGEYKEVSIKIGDLDEHS